MRTKIGVLFASVALAFGIAACAVQEPSDTTAATADTESALGGATTNGPQTFTCNGREPGLPISTAKEAQFESCMTSCTQADCKPECCQLVTKSPALPGGCRQCFLK